MEVTFGSIIITINNFVAWCTWFTQCHLFVLSSEKSSILLLLLYNVYDTTTLVRLLQSHFSNNLTIVRINKIPPMIITIIFFFVYFVLKCNVWIVHQLFRCGIVEFVLEVSLDLQELEDLIFLSSALLLFFIFPSLHNVSWDPLYRRWNDSSYLGINQEEGIVHSLCIYLHFNCKQSGLYFSCLVCSLFSPFWNWTSSILTLAFHTVMPQMIKLQLKVQKLL